MRLDWQAGIGYQLIVIDNSQTLNVNNCSWFLSNQNSVWDTRRRPLLSAALIGGITHWTRTRTRTHSLTHTHTFTQQMPQQTCCDAWHWSVSQSLTPATHLQFAILHNSLSNLNVASGHKHIYLFVFSIAHLFDSTCQLTLLRLLVP